MEQLIRVLLGMWGSFNQWSDLDLVTARTARGVMQVESVLREIQRESRQFQLMSLRELGVDVPQMGRPVEVYPRSRVDALEVYQRPARDAREALAGGGSPGEAWDAFEKRVRGIVEADVAIAERDELALIEEHLAEADLIDWGESGLVDEDRPIERDFSDKDEYDDSDLMSYEEMLDYLEASEDPEIAKRADSGKKVLGFRRVIRPELSQHGSCGLCVVAATNWYTIERLKPIHHLCKCVTVPVLKGNDPGFGWNQEDLRKNLDRMYGAAGDTTRGDKLKRIRVKIGEHGELGSVLEYRRKDGWRESDAGSYSPRGSRSYSRPDAKAQRERLEARREELIQTLENLRSRTVGDRGGLDHAIWDVEQSLKDLESRLAR